MPWWTAFFDQTYAAIGLSGSSEAALAKRARTLDLIVAKLGVSAGDTVFDQCCGTGRLSLPLAERGLRVIGVDQAASYIEVARERAKGLDCEFHVGDAFEFVAPRPCDGAINWFTSFGYHRDDRVNVRMLQRAHESLRSGGKLALDYVNVARVLTEFQSAKVDYIAQPDGELMLVQEPSIDFPMGMMRGKWTLIRADGTREIRNIENRAFMPYDFVRLFDEAGFVDVEVLGGEGEPFERTSRRCIVVGRKP